MIIKIGFYEQDELSYSFTIKILSFIY